MLICFQQRKSSSKHQKDSFRRLYLRNRTKVTIFFTNSLAVNIVVGVNFSTIIHMHFFDYFDEMNQPSGNVGVLMNHPARIYNARALKEVTIATLRIFVLLIHLPGYK